MSHSSLASKFKALSDPTRLDIIKRLKRRDLTPGELSVFFNISKPSLSHHLAQLKQTKLITSRKQGQNIYYSLNTPVFIEFMNDFLHYFK